MISDKNNNAKHQHWGRVGRSVLNGFIGDYLEKENNPLAIKMGFYHRRRRLILDEHLAQQVDFPLTNRVVIFVHGLTNLETIWDYPLPEDAQDGDLVDNYIESYFDFRGLNDSENYGQKLQADFSYTPFFVRYNTGLSIEKNARELSKLIKQLCSVYPIEIDELMLVGFSMGGLLLRQAQSNALESEASWLKILSKCIYIGSPHEGAFLEKIGYFTGEVFRQIPKSYMNQWADWIDAGSEGINSLKHGLKQVSDEETVKLRENGFSPTARHYFVSGALSNKKYVGLNFLVGDALVREASAVPQNAPVGSLSAKFEGASHVRLAHSEDVYQQIANWVQADLLKQQGVQDKNAKGLKRYNPVRKPYTAEDEDDVSTQALIAGTIDMIATGYDKTLEAVESMHFAISDEPFNVLQRLPVLSQISYPVEKLHNSILDYVYRSLRIGGKAAHGAAKQVAPCDIKSVEPCRPGVY